jgi:Zn-dependent protease with chaperone function
MLLGMLGFGLLWLVDVPFRVVELWWDRGHGVSHESYLAVTLGGWFALGFEFALLCVALGIVMALARRVGHAWWLLAAPLFVGLVPLDAFVAPYLVSTRPASDDPALAASVGALERRAHVGHAPVRIQDVSTDTSLPNAETEGIGPSRPVVVWSTLLDGRFSSGEIQVVVAHELGHVARAHIWKSMGWEALFLFPEAFLISVALRRRGGMGEPASVPLAVFVFVVFGLAALPVRNVISRHMESEADWLALQTTKDPRDATALFASFVPTALSDPSPPTWEYLFLDDHPTVDQRLAMVRAWRSRYATSVAQEP